MWWILNSSSLEWRNFLLNPQKINLSPNVFVDTTEKIKKVISYDINGRTLELPYSFSSIDINKLEQGHYFLDVFFENDKRSIMKIIKN